MYRYRGTQLRMLQLIFQPGVTRRKPIGQLVSQQPDAAIQGLNRSPIAEYGFLCNFLCKRIDREWQMQASSHEGARVCCRVSLISRCRGGVKEDCGAADCDADYSTCPSLSTTCFSLRLSRSSKKCINNVVNTNATPITEAPTNPL